MNHRPPIIATSAKDIFHFRSGKVAGKLLTNEVVVEVIAVVMHEDTLFGFLLGFFGGFFGFGGFDDDWLGLTLESENGFLVIHQRVVVLDRGEGSDERFFGGFFGDVFFEDFTTDIDMAGTGNQFLRSTTERLDDPTGDELADLNDTTRLVSAGMGGNGVLNDGHLVSLLVAGDLDLGFDFLVAPATARATTPPRHLLSG